MSPGTIRRLAWAAMLLCSATGAAPPPPCAIPGEPVQWMADYCFAELGTDDEIAAGDCIDSQLARRFASDCAAKGYYKRLLCGLMVENGSVRGPVERCVQDRSFAGDTVQNGGVGN